MADAVISALVDQFISSSLEKIGEEVRLVKNAKKDVERLKKSLRLIQALLEDAEKKQLDSASVTQWLSDLQETSYDMDDVLDEWNFTILKAKIEKEESVDDHADVPKKVCFSMPSSCLCFKQRVKEVISLRDFANKIKELNEELDRTKKDGNELGIVARAIEPSGREKHSSYNKPRITTSFVDETKIHGRDQDKAVLVSKLVCESGASDHKGKGFEIVPIVGMGGLGKTTLAQMAYNDDRVKAHFGSNQIWVCVSDPFDLMKIARAIVEGLGGNPKNYVELEGLMQFISESIKGKRFLLVLDDVWSKDKDTWEQLSQPLRGGAPGSRILVTTRNKEVVMMMGVSSRMIGTLETLSDEQCWSIIKQLANVEEENEQLQSQLEIVGKKIAKRCKGLPLTAKILGSLMCFKKSKRQWEDILHSQLWDSKAFDEIFAPFLLSYYDLSSIEKCCFSYCSVFSKDHVIDIDMLIEMWMSQGYVNESSKGRDCFESLAMRSFFQDFITKEDDGSTCSCKMHDIVHDFAQFLTKNKFVLMEGDGIKEKMESLDSQARHLTIAVKSPSQFPTFKPGEMNIGNRFRTLCVLEGGGNVEACGVELLNLTCFRTLRTLHLRSNLDSTGMALQSFPHSFPMMMHLRYLDLSRMLILLELPESLCDLLNLQTLRLLSCVGLQKLPKGIGKLINLRHLYICECYSLEGFPKGFEKLTRLQKIDSLVVPENKDTYFNLEGLNEFRRLEFQGSLTMKRCANFGNAEEAKKVKLENMEDLLTLNLIFNNPVPGDYAASEAEVTILEALRPHPYLTAMLIWYYRGVTVSPSWLPSLKNLRYLRIMDCCRCETLPPLGKLPSLESLEIRDMPRVKKIGLEFLGINLRSNELSASRSSQSPFVSFPMLKQLTFESMGIWKEWEGINEGGDSSIKVMPCLSSLTINVCWSLKTLPEFLLMTPLEYLRIDREIMVRKEEIKRLISSFRS